MLTLRSRQGKEFYFPIPYLDTTAIPWYLIKTFDSDDACFVGLSVLAKNNQIVWISFAYDTETRPAPPAPVEEEPDYGPIVAIAVAVLTVLLSCMFVTCVLYMSRAKNEEPETVAMATNPGQASMVAAKGV